MMKQKLISTFKPYRDRLLSPLFNKVDEIGQKVEEINSRIEAQAAVPRDNRTSIIPISDKLIIAKIFSGLKICLDPSDVAVVPHLALDGIWEEKMTKAWLSVLGLDQVVFDIGANFGYYGLLAAQKNFSEKQKIVFFEANPELVPYISKTLSINGLHKYCIIENLGVADTNGTAELTILEDFISCSSLHTEEHLAEYLGDKMPVITGKKVKITTVTIDDYCRDNGISEVDVMKLDIEGFEEKAYQGMGELVRNSKNLVLFLEFTKESYENPEVFYSQLLKDFKYLYLIGEAGELQEVKINGYDEIIGSAELFIMLVLSKRKLV